MAATAPFSSASSSHPPRLPSKTLTPRHSCPLHHRSPPAASAPRSRPLLLSFPAPARRSGAGLRASAAQKISVDYQFDEEDDDEEEYEYDGEEEEEEWEEDEDEEAMDVEALEEEARGAAADLAKRLARELHIGELLAKFLLCQLDCARFALKVCNCAIYLCHLSCLYHIRFWFCRYHYLDI